MTTRRELTMNVIDHELVDVEYTVTGQIAGSCSCSDPDYSDEGVYVGQVDFYGSTTNELAQQFEDHVYEVTHGEIGLG